MIFFFYVERGATHGLRQLTDGKVRPVIMFANRRDRRVTAVGYSDRYMITPALT